MVVTSNKPFSKWGEIFGDDMAATAMIDRQLLAQCPRSPSQLVGIRPRGFGAARRRRAVGILLKISATVRSRRAASARRRAGQRANTGALRIDSAAPRSLLVRARCGQTAVTSRGPCVDIATYAPTHRAVAHAIRRRQPDAHGLRRPRLLLRGAPISPAIGSGRAAARESDRAQAASELESKRADRRHCDRTPRGGSVDARSPKSASGRLPSRLRDGPVA